MDCNDEIFYKKDWTSENWTKINGYLKQVQSSGNAVCGVNSSDQIVCKDDL